MGSADSQFVPNDQLAAPNQHNLVSISADRFTSLMTAVDILRKELHQIRDDTSTLAKEVSQLRNTNASLASEIKCLKGHAGVGFGLFPKFPSEIRNMIWEFALMESQIHIFGKQSISRSRVNTIMQACRESRIKGLNLQLPYYKVSIHMDGGSAENPKYYFNPSVDIIWLPDKPDESPDHPSFEIIEFKFIPDCIRFFCGKCGENLSMSILDDEDCMHSVPKFRRLAVNYSNWRDPNKIIMRPNIRQTSMGTVEASWFYSGVRELIIVVNDTDAVNYRDVSFIRPAKVPWRSLYGPNPLETPPLWRLDTERSWDALAAEKMKELEVCRAKRQEWQTAQLEAGTTEWLFDHWTIGFDVSEWEVPTITYVEARSDRQKKDWMLCLKD